MKKQFQLIIVTLFLTSLTAYGQQVGDVLSTGAINYKIISIDPITVELIGQSYPYSDMTIPGRVWNGHFGQFRNVAHGAFNGSGKAEKDKLTRVTFDSPGNVTSMGNNALRDNKLGSVVIPDGVTTIGTMALRENQLTHVVIPNSVASMGGEAFTNNPINTVTARAIRRQCLVLRRFTIAVILYGNRNQSGEKAGLLHSRSHPDERKDLLMKNVV